MEITQQQAAPSFTKPDSLLLSETSWILLYSKSQVDSHPNQSFSTWEMLKCENIVTDKIHN